MDEITLRRRVGDAVRERRASMGFSQDTFADAIDMHRAYVGSIERGERNLTLNTLLRLATGLKWTVSELISSAEKLTGAHR